ncbi:MAG: hypothetical protein ACLP5V_02415 [Candidatus Bathyarchaeia archaeon]
MSYSVSDWNVEDGGAHAHRTGLLDVELGPFASGKCGGPAGI